MHIPDGLLSGEVCLATGAVSAAAVGYSLYRLRREFPERAAPLAGVLAACLFAAQMLNFPIPLGSSGHLLGGALAAILLGPWGGMVVMTAVLVVQAVLFQDGGVIALGANVLNMALLGSGLAYAIYAAVARWLGGLRGAIAGAVLAAWCGVVLGAVACTTELAASGVYPFAPALGAMLLAHSIIGLGEALVTGLALGYILRTRPDLIYGTGRASGVAGRVTEVILVGLTLAVLMAVCLSPFASKLPDGMEWTLERLGVSPETASRIVPAPLADYSVPGLAGLSVAGSIAGAVGVVAVFALAYFLARALCPARAPEREVEQQR